VNEAKLLESLESIKEAIERNNVDMRTGDAPGVVEGGFMRLHDKLDDVVYELNRQNDHLSKIAEALVYMTRAIE